LVPKSGQGNQEIAALAVTRSNRRFTTSGLTDGPSTSIEHLIQSKRTGRLHDAADVAVLGEIGRLRGE
jgi:hypothetical protein